MEDKSRIWGISDVKAFLISIITGFILLTIVAVIFTEISNETVNKTADGFRRDRKPFAEKIF